MFTFKINNTTVTDPLEWAEFTETLEYDQQFNGILMKYNQKFTFVNDAYDLISNYLATNGYCNRLPLQVLYQCGSEPATVMLDGFIFLTEAKFNRSKCTVEVEFEDNSYTGKIYSNRNVKAYINADLSKNGVTITPATKLNITMFICNPANPYNATLAPFTRGGYDLADCFRYLIDFMTDGTVGFVSDWYTNLPVTEKIAVTSGTLLRLTAPKNEEPNISFGELFEEVRKKMNIAWALEKDSLGQPRIRIENFDYFKNTTNQSASITDIPELIEYIDSDKLYAQVNIGSNEIPFKATLYDLWPVPFLTHRKENYYIQGECNTDEELDLVSSWIIDSNTIEALTLTDTANTDYDKNHAFIQYNSSTNAAVSFNNIDLTTAPNKKYYNYIFTNAQVAGKFNLQGAIAKYLGAAVPGFEAENTTGTAPQSYTASNVIPVVNTFVYTFTDYPYQDDFTPPNQDPGGNYNAATYRFIAPTSGIYSFDASYFINITSNPKTRPSIFNSYSYWEIRIFELDFIKYDPAGVPNGTTTLIIPGNWIDGVGIHGSYSGGTTVYMESAEQLSVQVKLYGFYNFGSPTPDLNTITFNIQDGSFKLISSNTGGGIFDPKNDANSYFTSIYEFEQVLSEADWTSIVNNPQNFMRFSMTQNAGQKGWLRKIERNKATGLTKFTLTSNFNNQ